MWLAFRKRTMIKKMLHGQDYRVFKGLVLIAIGLSMFIFAWRKEYLSISTMSLIPLLFGMVYYLYGRSMVKALSFPIIYLILLVPPPIGIIDSITLPMRYGISLATGAFLRLAHYPITREGLLFSFSGHQIYMGTPCSGFRSLITMMSLGLIYAYMSKGSRRKKLFLVLSVIPIALLGNFIRVTGVCVSTYHFGPSFAQKFHDYSGFIIFIALILALAGLDSLMEKK